MPKLAALLLVMLASVASGLPAPRGGIVENCGQLAAMVHSYVNCGDATIYFTKTAVVLDLPRRQHALWMRFTDANASTVLELRDEQPTRLHYFTGADPRHWRSDRRVYSELVYRDLWPGVDVVFRPEPGQLRYWIRAGAASDRTGARFEFEGADRVAKSGSGALRIEIPGHACTDCAVSPAGTERVLRWGSGAASEALPVPGPNAAGSLSWSTFLGGSSNDYSHGLAVDSADRPVVTGYALSTDFPTSPGAYDSTHAGGYDVFVAKLDAGGSTLLWATFLGGNQEDRPFALALDASGHVVVAGHTFSADFPTTPGAYDRILNGTRDVFVAMLDADGSSLRWSTYLGGAAWERAWGMALTTDGRPVVAGETSSTDFPTTLGAYDTALGGGVDGFVTELEADGRSLRWSTFVGGSSSDWINAVALDHLQRPVAAGTTYSADYPVTPGAFDPSANGVADGFVTKLAADGGTAVYSTYLGGAGVDVAYALGVNAQGQAVVTGSTTSADFPVTAGAFDVSYNGGGDLFVAQFDTAGAALSWSTFVGGSAVEEAYALILDPEGRPMVAGETASADFPTTWDGFDRVYGGNRDAFVTQVRATGDSLRWSSFLGGGQWDSGWDFALDSTGNPLLTGPTRSGDFPTSAGAYDRVYNGGAEDVFVTRFELRTPAAADPVGPSALRLWAGPNPFRRSVQLRFHLSQPGAVQLSVFDAAGHRVAALLPEMRAAGANSLVWPGRDPERGVPVPGGVYWLRLQTPSRVLHASVIRVR